MIPLCYLVLNQTKQYQIIQKKSNSVNKNQNKKKKEKAKPFKAVSFDAEQKIPKANLLMWLLKKNSNKISKTFFMKI